MYPVATPIVLQSVPAGQPLEALLVSLGVAVAVATVVGFVGVFVLERLATVLVPTDPGMGKFATVPRRVARVLAVAIAVAAGAVAGGFSGPTVTVSLLVVTGLFVLVARALRLDRLVFSRGRES